MGKLQNNQEGASHIILVVVFLLVLAGLVGFAYNRISENDSSNKNTSSSEQAADEEGSPADEESDQIEEDNSSVDDLDTE